MSGAIDKPITSIGKLVSIRVALECVRCEQYFTFDIDNSLDSTMSAGIARAVRADGGKLDPKNKFLCCDCVDDIISDREKFAWVTA